LDLPLLVAVAIAIVFKAANFWLLVAFGVIALVDLSLQTVHIVH
jgi:hypothetical protein